MKELLENVIRNKNMIYVKSGYNTISFIDINLRGSLNVEILSNGQYGLFYKTHHESFLVSSGSQRDVEYVKGIIWNKINYIAPPKNFKLVYTVLIVSAILAVLSIAVSTLFIDGFGSVDKKHYSSTSQSIAENKPKNVVIQPENTVTAIPKPPIVSTNNITQTPKPVAPATLSENNKSSDDKSLESIIKRISQTNAPKAQEIVKALNEIAEYVSRSEDVPQELIEKLPSEVILKLVKDAQENGYSMPNIKKKVSSNVIPEKATPVVALPNKATPVVALLDKVTPVASLPSPQNKLSEKSTVTDAYKNVDLLSQKDRYGISTIPDKDSRVGVDSMGSDNIKFGDLAIEEDMETFNLPSK